MTEAGKTEEGKTEEAKAEEAKARKTEEAEAEEAKAGAGKTEAGNTETGETEESRKRILIAEDSPTVVTLLLRALEPLGHEIVVASDGADAERRIAERTPDLLILDIIMPRINGFQLCRTIRSNPALRKLPIIVVTSMDRESDRYWGLKQGADEYLVKPIDPGVLVEKVRSYL